MDSASANNEDDEPKICTVFSSDSNTSKTIFDTIAFSTSTKKETGCDKPSSSFATDSEAAAAIDSHSRVFATESKPFLKGDDPLSVSKSISSSNQADQAGQDLHGIEEEAVSKNHGKTVLSEDAPLPCANVLFADAPEIPFPVGIGPADPPPVQSFLSNTLASSPDMTIPLTLKPKEPEIRPCSTTDIANCAWIPTDETRRVLLETSSGIYDNGRAGQMATMPGIVHEEDMFDKVSVNMARIFGEAEADRRKILTADSVTQDDNGLRELIKLGCYRSAINLTKRLLTQYGQGAGRLGQFSKHTPHSLQVWYTRILLLVRIREFTVADAEIEAFRNFDNPDMYYEYYPDFYSRGFRGSMVPFHFRLLGAEIPQYMRRANETTDKLTHIFTVVRQIISNVSQGLCEDGNPVKIDEARKSTSLDVWTQREIRVLYSLANSAVFCKDFNGAVIYLSELIQKDPEHEMQLKSSLGRLFLQFGDLASAERYFSSAADVCNPESESSRADVLADAGLLAIGQNNYVQALQCFQDALAIQPENHMLVNNVAVCLVYLGRVKDALALMESTVKQNTPQLLQENVILNLSTVYELENSDGSKKNMLLRLISEYKGDGINLASLKMPNLV